YPHEARHQSLMARTCIGLAWVYHETGRKNESERLFLETVARLEKLVAEHHQHPFSGRYQDRWSFPTATSATSTSPSASRRKQRKCSRPPWMPARNFISGTRTSPSIRAGWRGATSAWPFSTV